MLCAEVSRGRGVRWSSPLAVTIIAVSANTANNHGLNWWVLQAGALGRPCAPPRCCRACSSVDGEESGSGQLAIGSY